MLKYVAKKLIMLIVTLLVTSFVVFLIFNIIPGDPAIHKLGTQATPEKLEALRNEMGLNAPFFARYFNWLFKMFVGDFGKSYSSGVAVSKIIGGKLMINGTLSFMAIIIVSIVSIPLGIYCAKHTGGLIDKIFVVINQICMSFPPFLLGIILTFIFAFVFHLFSPGGYVSYDRNFGKFIGYLILPSLSLAIPKIAMCIRLLKGNILSEATKDYARTAYSRGNNTTGLLYKHILKNAIMPTITFIGMVLADMIASSIIIEQTFNIPGLGRTLINAIGTRDYPVVEVIILMIALMVMVISTATDIIHACIDPRVTNE